MAHHQQHSRSKRRVPLRKAVPMLHPRNCLQKSLPRLPINQPKNKLQNWIKPKQSRNPKTRQSAPMLLLLSQLKQPNQSLPTPKAAHRCRSLAHRSQRSQVVSHPLLQSLLPRRRIFQRRDQALHQKTVVLLSQSRSLQMASQQIGSRRWRQGNLQRNRQRVTNAQVLRRLKAMLKSQKT